MRFLALLPLVIALSAQANDLMVLNDEETIMSGSDHSLMDRRLGRVSLEVKADCITCGDTAWNIEKSSVSSILNGEFLNELKRQLRTNGVLDQQNEKRIALQVNVLKMSHDSTVGASEQRKNPMTNGGSMVTSVTLEYVLLDGEQEVLRMPLTTQGVSNSVSPKDSVNESISIALKKNIRVYLLATKAALEPSFAATAEPQIQAIMAENKSTRSIMGSFALGLGKLGMGVANAAGTTLKVLASPEVAQGMNSALQQHARTQRQIDVMQTQAMLNARQQSSSSTSTSTHYDKPTTTSIGSDPQRDRTSAKSQTGSSLTLASTTDRQQRDTASQQKQSSAQTKDAQDKARKNADAEAKAQSLKEEQRKEQLALKQKEREEKRRQDEASKLAEQLAAQQAKEQYLRNVAAGTRLVATKCPDGEGKYYATGSRPRIRPEVVSCVDVRFRASCPGGREYSDVTAHNFIGMSGCFGDTYEISPKLSCKVDQVHISVLEAKPCQR